MSKPSLDSDLYGDIYGDEEDGFADLQDAPTQEQDLEEEVEIITGPAELDESAFSSVAKPGGSAFNDAHNSLPSKPSASSAGLSYSAQVAKQFSAYQQTPSQERQQRTEFPLPRNPRMAAVGRPANIPTFTSADKVSSGPGVSSETVFGKKPSEMHDHGKMFIGGLSWATTDEGLRDYFSQFGKVIFCGTEFQDLNQLIHGKVDAVTIMRDPTGTSRGFAFLTFEDANSVNAVLGQEHSLDGKAIDPKRAIPREEHLRNTRYFVGGLSPDTTPESMRQFFGAYGKVVDATVMLDRESGRSKGFGFVTFEDANNADLLVGKLGLILDDKQIEVKAAQPRSQRDQQRTSNSSHSNLHTNSSSQADNFDQRGTTASNSMNFMPSNQPNPMQMLYPMSQMPFAMMGMNPMMSMGMNAFNMVGGVPGMMNLPGGALDGVANGMGNMGPMRLGVGPVAASAMLRNTPQMGNIRTGGMGRLQPVANPATRTYLGIDVAIKEVLPSTEYDVAKYFEREWRLMKECRHPNICLFIGLSRAPAPDNRIFIISEFIENGNVRIYIHDKSKPFPWRLRLSFATDVTRALAYLHARRCIHRDLKGENLLVTSNGRLKITDFGFARIAARNEEESKRLTFCGTDSYMSPEILLGDEFDLSTDIFSLGIIFCEIGARKLADDHHFKRHPPTFGIDVNEVKKLMSAGYPEDFYQLCIDCCATDPKDRPTTRDILDRLRTIEAEVLSRPDEGADMHLGSVRFMTGGKRPTAAPRIPSFGVGVGKDIRSGTSTDESDEELMEAVMGLNGVGLNSSWSESSSMSK
ncbi:hypothetical protein NLJ89_g10198 [Agrocybe chaxingu]|uniref:Protein kinase domain-containing protein n=1 Tax=Agrocybe chaxingu TaxID=84603 RepID=A0A9W8JRM4_9AGAR|nr:hypothetical protein NLJ89_g10198 [Agrocybe chaxingu]